VSVEPSVHAQLGGALLANTACTDDGHCIAIGTYIAGTIQGWVATFRIVGGH
jgi:hypothetical protein